MERNNLIARILRAFSGKSQEDFGDDTGLHPTTVSNIERGEEEPMPETMEALAAGVGLTVEKGADILRFCETLQRQRLRPGRDPGDLFEGLEKTVRLRTDLLVERLLRLPLPGESPGPEDRRHATERMAVLRKLAEPTRRLLVQVDEDYRTWAVVEQAVEASAEAEAENPREARAWARLAVEIAQNMRGTEDWRNRVQGLALAQEARVLKAAGDRNAAATFEEAKKLWCAGSDPGQLLDAGGMSG
jgi:transcriptional regulator with XRE-family HTH domain